LPPGTRVRVSEELLCLAVLAAFGVRRLRSTVAGGDRAAALWLLPVLVLIEFASVPLPMEAVAVGQPRDCPCTRDGSGTAGGRAEGHEALGAALRLITVFEGSRVYEL
jgi:hypothetical protein